MLEKYQAYIQKPTKKITENRARKAIWNDFPQRSVKKAVLVFRKRLQACIRAEVNTLSTYFHSNQHSRPSHKNLPFQGRHIILKKSLEVDLCLFKLGSFEILIIFRRNFITFEVFNILQYNLVETCQNISSISPTKIVQKYLTVIKILKFR